MGPTWSTSKQRSMDIRFKTDSARPTDVAASFLGVAGLRTFLWSQFFRRPLSSADALPTMREYLRVILN